MADLSKITWFYWMQVDLARYLIQLRADPDARDDTVPLGHESPAFACIDSSWDQDVLK